jgi:hypothetical protein
MRLIPTQQHLPALGVFERGAHSRFCKHAKSNARQVSLARQKARNLRNGGPKFFWCLGGEEHRYLQQTSPLYQLHNLTVAGFIFSYNPCQLPLGIHNHNYCLFCL